jgi:polysaccharide deacetylase family protein (PEP-CTERM system associated)
MAVLNALTVDLEDWPQAVLDPSLPVSDHVLRNAERVLDVLGRCGVRATFFALGRVCERYPGLLPAIASAGHEIASHGYGHELVYRQTPERFEADLKRSAELIIAQTGVCPKGYRAPAFSITRRSLWAGAILARAGFAYSSSVFPIRKRRYGIADHPATPCRWPGIDLTEFPLTTLSLLGHRFPVCGGGYLRLLPARVHAWAIARRNHVGIPAVLYVHPYEFAPGEVSAFVRAGMSVPARRRLMQSLWRSRVEPRLRFLLERFHFGPMAEAIGALPAPLPEAVVAAPGARGFAPAGLEPALA